MQAPMKQGPKKKPRRATPTLKRQEPSWPEDDLNASSPLDKKKSTTSHGGTFKPMKESPCHTNPDDAKPISILNQLKHLWYMEFWDDVEYLCHFVLNIHTPSRDPRFASGVFLNDMQMTSTLAMLGDAYYYRNYKFQSVEYYKKALDYGEYYTPKLPSNYHLLSMKAREIHYINQCAEVRLSEMEIRYRLAKCYIHINKPRLAIYILDQLSATMMSPKVIWLYSYLIGLTGGSFERNYVTYQKRFFKDYPLAFYSAEQLFMKHALKSNKIVDTFVNLFNMTAKRTFVLCSAAQTSSSVNNQEKPSTRQTGAVKPTSAAIKKTDSTKQSATVNTTVNMTNRSTNAKRVQPVRTSNRSNSVTDEKLKSSAKSATTNSAPHTTPNTISKPHCDGSVEMEGISPLEKAPTKSNATSAPASTTTSVPTQFGVENIKPEEAISIDRYTPEERLKLKRSITVDDPFNVFYDDTNSPIDQKALLEVDPNVWPRELFAALVEFYAGRVTVAIKLLYKFAYRSANDVDRNNMAMGLLGTAFLQAGDIANGIDALHTCLVESRFMPRFIPPFANALYIQGRHKRDQGNAKPVLVFAEKSSAKHPANLVFKLLPYFGVGYGPLDKTVDMAFVMPYTCDRLAMVAERYYPDSYESTIAAAYAALCLPRQPTLANSLVEKALSMTHLHEPKEAFICMLTLMEYADAPQAASNSQMVVNNPSCAVPTDVLMTSRNASSIMNAFPSCFRLFSAYIFNAYRAGEVLPVQYRGELMSSLSSAVYVDAQLAWNRAASNFVEARVELPSADVDGINRDVTMELDASSSASPLRRAGDCHSNDVIDERDEDDLDVDSSDAVDYDDDDRLRVRLSDDSPSPPRRANVDDPKAFASLSRARFAERLLEMHSGTHPTSVRALGEGVMGASTWESRYECMVVASWLDTHKSNEHVPYKLRQFIESARAEHPSCPLLMTMEVICLLRSNKPNEALRLHRRLFQVYPTVRVAIDLLILYKQLGKEETSEFCALARALIVQFMQHPAVEELTKGGSWWNTLTMRIAEEKQNVQQQTDVELDAPIMDWPSVREARQRRPVEQFSSASSHYMPTHPRYTQVAPQVYGEGETLLRRIIGGDPDAANSYTDD